MIVLIKMMVIKRSKHFVAHRLVDLQCKLRIGGLYVIFMLSYNHPTTNSTLQIQMLQPLQEAVGNMIAVQIAVCSNGQPYLLITSSKL